MDRSKDINTWETLFASLAQVAFLVLAAFATQMPPTSLGQYLLLKNH